MAGKPNNTVCELLVRGLKEVITILWPLVGPEGGLETTSTAYWGRESEGRTESLGLRRAFFMDTSSQRLLSGLLCSSPLTVLLFAPGKDTAVPCTSGILLTCMVLSPSGLVRISSAVVVKNSVWGSTGCRTSARDCWALLIPGENTAVS